LVLARHRHGARAWPAIPRLYGLARAHAPRAGV